MMMMMMLMTMVLMMMMVMMVMTLMLMLMMMVVMMMIFHLRGASSSALATDRQVRLAGPARGRCALAGRSRPGHLAGPGGGTSLRLDTLVVDDDGEGHIYRKCTRRNKCVSRSGRGTSSGEASQLYHQF